MQKIENVSDVKIVQIGTVFFVDNSGFVNLDEQRPFSVGLFIDFFLKNGILNNVIRFHTKRQISEITLYFIPSVGDVDRDYLKREVPPFFMPMGMKNFIGFYGAFARDCIYFTQMEENK